MILNEDDISHLSHLIFNPVYAHHATEIDYDLNEVDNFLHNVKGFK